MDGCSVLCLFCSKSSVNVSCHWGYCTQCLSEFADPGTAVKMLLSLSFERRYQDAGE